MPCESCRCQFTVFKRKKPCTECKRLFCTNCLVKKKERIICERCLVFTKRPISKTELLALKPKDLIFYLQSKHISTDGCLEKEELVNLVMIQVNNSNFSRNQPDSSFDENITNPFDQIKQTCQNLFTSFSEKIAADLNFETKASTSTATTTNLNQQNISNQPRSSAAPPNNIYSNSCSSSSASSQTYSNVPQQPTNKNIPSNTSSSGPASPISLDSNGSSVNGIRNNNNIQASPSHDLRNSIPSVHTTKPKNKNHNIYENSTTASGCECSDDETIHKFQNNYKKSSPGTSRQGQVNPSVSISNGGPDSSNTSSFEELGQAAGTSSDTDNWQFIQGCDNINSIKQEEPSINSSIDLNSIPFTQHSATQLNSTGITPAAKKLTRRRSDTFLNRATTNTGENDDISDESGEVNFIGEESSRKRSRTSCNKCGKSKNNLKKYVQRLRAKLDYSNTTEEEKREQLEAFLKFLENRSSLDISDDETEVTTPVVQEEIINIETPVIHIEPADFLGGMEGIHVYPVDEDEGNSEEERRRLNARAHKKLDEVSSKSDLEDLSVKQLKEILMLNRVDYKGCCEKNELIDRVYRLWIDYKTCPSIEKLATDEICRICMDAPIECVILECGHMACCTNCGKILSECPICRTYIVRVVRFFKA